MKSNFLILKKALTAGGGVMPWASLLNVFWANLTRV